MVAMEKTGKTHKSDRKTTKARSGKGEGQEYGDGGAGDAFAKCMSEVPPHRHRGALAAKFVDATSGTGWAGRR